MLEEPRTGLFLLLFRKSAIQPCNSTVAFMPKIEFDGLPVIEVLDSEEITIAVKPEDLQEGDETNPEQHPIAIALRREHGVDDARVSKREVLIRRGDQWFRYGAPKRVS